MRNKLIAYASEFTSFLLENGIVPRNVILFGSVVTGEFDKESDIDIFIDIDKSKNSQIKGILRIFDKIYGEKWKLKGVSNPISLKVGDLQEWRDLRRSIQGHGITLYGKYAELPENIKPYLLFRLNFSKMSRAKKVSVWREIYGYSQKVGRKKYEKKGLIRTLEGKKLEKGIVLMPSEKAGEFRKFIRENKIDFYVNEIWSDSL